MRAVRDEQQGSSCATCQNAGAAVEQAEFLSQWAQLRQANVAHVPQHQDKSLSSASAVRV
jgi:hypothetical protein